MTLQKEIDKKAKNIFTDRYPMSIGELISLYIDKELDLHPDFQRFFRWDSLQKTRFIESILIGIPIPSIFVYQRDDGVWDVIDGVQRLSTIFQFIGILEDENGERISPIQLKESDYLPSLKGKMWKNEGEEDEEENDDPENYFTMSQRIKFKRAKLEIKIIGEKNEQNARYELFKRINLGGTGLSEQEVRNFLLIMINKGFFIFLKELADYYPFQECTTSFLETMYEKQYDLELISKFLVFRNFEIKDITESQTISDFITNKMMELAMSDDFDQEREKDIFEKTFKLLIGTLKDDSFRQFNKDNNSFSGGFSIGAYEAVVTGIGANIDKWELENGDKLETKIKSLWEDSDLRLWVKSKNEKERILNLIPLAKKWFHDE